MANEIASVAGLTDSENGVVSQIVGSIRKPGSDIELTTDLANSCWRIVNADGSIGFESRFPGMTYYCQRFASDSRIPSQPVEASLFVKRATSEPYVPSEVQVRRGLWDRLTKKDFKTPEKTPSIQQPLVTELGDRAILWQYALYLEVPQTTLIDGENQLGKFDRDVLSSTYSQRLILGDLGPGGEDFIKLAETKPAVARLIARVAAKEIVSRASSNPANEPSDVELLRRNRLLRTQYHGFPAGLGMRYMIVDESKPQRYKDATNKIIPVGNSELVGFE